MNSDTFVEAVRSDGLGLSSDGAVYDKRGEYLRADGEGVQTGTAYVRYADIGGVAYNKEWGMLTLLPEAESGLKEVVLRPSTKSIRPVERTAPVPEEPEPPAEEKPLVLSYDMPMTVSDLRDTFRVLYPGMKQMLWYDELAERQMVDLRMFGRPGGAVPLSDALMCVYHEDVERKLRANGFRGKRFPAMNVRDEALAISVVDNRRNKFREWMESHEWDGTHRIATLFRDYFGGTAPPLAAIKHKKGEPSVEELYLADVAEAWLLGAVKRAYSETKHEIVPVFIGQQGVGKGTALKFLAGQDEWYRDTTVNFDKPEKFLDAVRGAIIVELGEGVQLNTDDMGVLKAFISQSSDHMRKAYARFDETYPRHFILAASSNVDTLFKDPTGARRFFPVYCDPDVQERYGKIIPTNGRPADLQYEVEQIWAEALALYRGGGKWYLRDERSIRAAQMMQLYCSEEKVSDEISDYLDNTGLYAVVGAMVTKKDVLEGVFHLSEQSWRQPDAERAWKEWISNPVGWVRVPNPVKLNGKTARVYRRVSTPGEEARRRTFRLIDADAWTRRNAEDLYDLDAVARMRRWLEDHPCLEGDILDVRGLSDRDIDDFMMQGFIVDDGRSKSNHVYRLVFSP